MKKYTLFIVAFLTISLSFAQTNYTNGFNAGYKKGFCQDQGIGCIEPIPPISPVPKIGESSDSYNDGYNRGFQTGLNARKSNSNERTRYKTAKPKFIDYTSSSNDNLINLKIKVLNKLSKRALENLENENYESAIDNANSMIKIHSTYGIAYVYKSNAQYQLGQILNAYNNSIKAVRVYSRSDIREWKDFMYKKMGEHLTSLMSENRYNDVIYITENFWYKSNLGNYYRAFGYYYKQDYSKAKKYFKKVKDNETAQKFLKSIKSENYISNPFTQQSRTTTQTTNNPNVDLQAIFKLLQNGKYQKCIDLIDKSIESDEPELLFGIRGTANYLLKNYSEAISDITKSAKTNKEILPDFLFYRALSKSEVSDFYGAIRDYDLLIEKGDAKGQNYDLATVYNNKAYSYVELKQYKKAVPFVTKALELDKSKWYIWDTRAEIYFNTGEYGKAINDASKAIKIQENANTFYIKGLAHIKLNEKILGCKDLSRAGELGKSEAYNEIKKHCN